MISPYRLALTYFNDLAIGPVRHASLLEVLGSDENIWRASADELQSGGLTRDMAIKFIEWRATQDPQALLDDTLKRGISLVTLDDPEYPQLLRAIHDAPYVLYYRGTLPPADALLVGVVGSRRATDYGLRVAADLSEKLARHHLVIVSGLAWGIDEAAHKATVKANGKTIAVLGCGLDANDSYRKIQLAEEIVSKGGAIISEYPPEMPSYTHHFPIRNRIISGMSKGTLVVEAAEKSGSLITARAALMENREVFAVPGSIHSPTSVGTNRLCRDGAHVVTSAEDILNVLGVTPRETANEARATMIPPATPEARAILELLNHEPKHIDDLAIAVALPSHTVGGTLTIMEIEGYARHVGGGNYTR
ncbi:TPA: DNA-protecting protein DprA [Candidatus Uhrbacteria bacterium]|nr:DNA-protecting protein DprA [Candidatus Uhrbacteria bacterium]